MGNGANISLPSGLSDLLDEVRRLEEKQARAVALQADDNAIQAIGDALARLRKDVTAALVHDAKQEGLDGAEKAGQFIEGILPDAAVTPGEDQQRIAAAEDEIKRIREKIKKAQQHGAGPAEVDGLNDDLDDLKRPLREAALAAARRELREVREELNRIRRGLPPRDPKNGKGGPGSGGGGGGGGAGGGGAGEGDDTNGNGPVGVTTDTEGKEDALTIFVRSDRTVWAWNRADARWVAQSFDSDLVEVEMISGGILAVAEHGAAMWDTYLGRWLGRLSVPSEVLEEGEAS